MIFLDASAVISIVTGGPDADDLADRLEPERLRLCSAVAVFETVAALVHSHTFSVSSAREHVKRFLATAGVQMVGIGDREFDFVADAYEQYGKGRHPAGLNAGDCFAYACARANRATLLFTGDDFAKTDVAKARPYP